MYNSCHVHRMDCVLTIHPRSLAHWKSSHGSAHALQVQRPVTKRSWHGSTSVYRERHREAVHHYRLRNVYVYSANLSCARVVVPCVLARTRSAYICCAHVMNVRATVFCLKHLHYFSPPTNSKAAPTQLTQLWPYAVNFLGEALA